MATKISRLVVRDIRFPTSRTLAGSDAINTDPDYSAAYVVLETDDGHCGYGLIFTIGRGNDICCRAVEAMSHLVVGRDFDEITANLGCFCADLRADSQLRWLGPEKGVIHMAAGSIVNCVWDLWARREGKPVWRLACDLSPEQFVDTLDLRYLSDVLTRDEALAIVSRNHASRHERIAYLERHGYPAYSTSAGWLGYSDEKLAALCREALAQGFKSLKLKVGVNLDDDIRRCRIARDTVGQEVRIMIDANQIWEVEQAIEWVNRLAVFKPLFIEEPTSPDDLFGHRKIKQALHGVKVATGEHCHNRIMFKQLIANDAIDIVQVDACRLAGLSEMLTVGLMAAKFGKPVCPHAGGVGLCEYVQHFSMIDYVMISADLEGRMAEYVEHLHEHFEDPCVIRDGSYVAPSQPGYSIKMRDASLARYEYPIGSEWSGTDAARCSA
jgi:L-fuconate dehydratase